jgi:branched-chain amino acid transport system permease protein
MSGATAVRRGDSLLERVLPSGIANLVLLAAVTIAGFLYAAGGSSARDGLITDLLVNLIIVIGFHIFIGNTGVLSFGHVGISAFGSYVMALLAIPVARKVTLIPNAPFGIAKSSMGIVAASLLGVVLAIALSFLLAVVVARTSGLAATMITLALLFVVKQVAENWKDLTNGAGNLSSIPRLTGNTWPIIGAVIAIIVAVVFKSSRTGRLAIATREDELAAGAMGINVFRPRFWAFVVSGAVVALGGILRVQSLGSLGPQQFSFDFTILILAMLVVGGMQTVTGAIVGTVFITVGKEIARFLGDGPDFLGFTWPKVDGLPDLFLAASLLIVLLLRPTGLLGRFDLGSLLKRLVRTPTTSVPTVVSNDATRSGAALTTNGLGVTFGGFTAVDNVSIKVEPGQIHGLIGPNGAGKTTLINLLTGVVEATRGTVDLGGRDMVGAPYVRARAGIARTFQNLRVFSALSVRENVATADITAAKYRPDRPTPGVDALLDLVGLSAMADRSASTLDYGSQRRLEIARAAALRPDFLLLDEPTSGMSESESLTMVDDVRRVAQAIGSGVLVVDHDLGFITRICDYITVLDQGSVLAAGTPAEIQKDQRVIDAYLGTTGTSGSSVS